MGRRSQWEGNRSTRLPCCSISDLTLAQNTVYTQRCSEEYEKVSYSESDRLSLVFSRVAFGRTWGGIPKVGSAIWQWDLSTECPQYPVRGWPLPPCNPLPHFPFQAELLFPVLVRPIPPWLHVWLLVPWTNQYIPPFGPCNAFREPKRGQGTSQNAGTDSLFFWCAWIVVESITIATITITAENSTTTNTGRASTHDGTVLSTLMYISSFNTHNSLKGRYHYCLQQRKLKPEVFLTYPRSHS